MFKMQKYSAAGILGILLIGLQSCSVKSENTYFKDTSTSMQTNVQVDRGMLGLFSMMAGTGSGIKKSDLNTLPADWKSFYDIQKTGKIVLNDKDAGALKKIFLKTNTANGEIAGLSVKYDKLFPKEIAALFADTRYLNRIPMQDFGKWDGKNLTINTAKLNVADAFNILESAERPELKTPKTKYDSIENYGRQMAAGMVGLMKMVNMNFSNTLKFQKPIRKISGKHDFIRQTDSHTVEINVSSKDLWDNGKNLTNKDPEITITTD